MGRFRWLLVALMMLAACPRAVALSYYARRQELEKQRERQRYLNELRQLQDKRNKAREEKRKAEEKEAAKKSLESMKAAFKKGEEALREQRYSVAYLHFNSVASAGAKGGSDLATKARAKAREIEAMAEAKLQLAKVLMMRHEMAEAAEAFLEVVENFGYCRSASEARVLLSRLRSTPSVAASLRYSDGKAQEDAENYLKALRIYDEVARRWPDELAALRARVAAKKVRRDPEKMVFHREALEAEAERKCPTLITMAKSFLMNLATLEASEDPDAETMAELKLQAVEKLQSVVREYPGTTYAGLAARAAKLLSKGDVAEARSLLDQEPAGKKDEGAGL